jgi:hypothetical protein
MKKVATFVFAILLGASLSFGQATGGSTGKPAEKGKTETGKKATKTKKGHKGGKKGKKGSGGGTTTPAPK